MNSSQQIKFGALLSYISLGINIASGLIYTPWMISSIGRESYGLYTLAMSVISLFVFDFGLSNSVTRFLSKYLAEDRQDKADQCLGLVYRLYLYIDVFFLFVLTSLYFFIPQIYSELTTDEIAQFKVVYVMAALFSILSFPFIPVNGILTANEKFVQLKVCEIIHKLLIVCSMTICLLLSYGLYALVFVNALSGLATIALKLWFINRDTNTHLLFSYRNRRQLREIVNFSAWTTIVAVCQRMMFAVAPTILGIFSGSVSIAIFGIANTIEGYVFTFSSALSGMFLPRISRIISQKNGDIMPLMIKVGRIQLYVVGAVVMGFICVGREFVTLWVGVDFIDSYACTLLLIIPSLFQLPQEIGMQAIVADNKVREQAFVWMIVAILNIVLSLFLTWKCDVFGLCLSIFISFIVRTIGMDVIFKRTMNLNLRLFFHDTFLHVGFMIVVVSSLSLLSYTMIDGDDLLSFFIKFTIFVVFFSIGFKVVANQEERNLVLQLFHSFKSKLQ